ncbi:S9 family peptidase [Chitinophaga sp. HK235]|uniref:alpha/beta hydrolase family protein n=1 Tax=Chitinophaga sp. HK235 TaxID=2952571 RepID=UPI001BA55BFF|nr:alpha/beta hydrolase [Chitinophaga sp. HK235]
MRKIIRLSLILLGFLGVVSLYANFLHPLFFFGKKPLVNTNSAFLAKGRDIAFTSGDVTLKGKIFTKAPQGAKVPLIVFCVGSGPNSSHATSYARMLDTMFLQNLPMDSIALLCFDKRGIGESDGDWYNASFEQRAADAKAAADYGATLPFVDPKRIIIVGHSQGGWIVQLALAQYPETFVGGISMAGPVFSVRRQLVNDRSSSLACHGMDTVSAIKKAEWEVSRDITFSMLFPFMENWKQLQVIKDFEPAPYLKKIKTPILLLWGSQDPLVSPQWCREALAANFPQGLPANFDTLTITGANHGFKIAGCCYEGSYAQVPYAAACKVAMLSWIRKKFL